MVSFDRPWPVTQHSTTLPTGLEDVIRQAATLKGWEPEETVVRINRLIGKYPELRKELDTLLLESFERAVTGEQLGVGNAMSREGQL